MNCKFVHTVLSVHACMCMLAVDEYTLLHMESESHLSAISCPPISFFLITVFFVFSSLFRFLFFLPADNMQRKEV